MSLRTLIKATYYFNAMSYLLGLQDFLQCMVKNQTEIGEMQQCALVLLQRFARFQSLLVRAVELTAAGLKNAEMQCKNTL